MGKPTICTGESKGADQLRSNCEADQRLCFRYMDSTILFYINPKFQASSSFLCLYRSVCVGPVRKPHCWFSHEAAHLFFQMIILPDEPGEDNPDSITVVLRTPIHTVHRRRFHQSDTVQVLRDLSLCVRKPNNVGL